MLFFFREYPSYLVRISKGVSEEMKLSAKVEYGVRAMSILAFYYRTGPLPLREIAEQEKISLKFLEQIFPNLRRARLITSVRGSRGGYMLAHSPAEIKVGDIVRAVEGPITPVNCLAESGSEPCCHRRDACLTRQVWEKLRDRINDVLDEVTLDELIDIKPAEIRKGEEF
jgi:Rrf2 family transcriptional regulator, cysteine metabolism repressor